MWYFQDVPSWDCGRGVSDVALGELGQDVPGGQHEGTRQAAIVCQDIKGKVEFHGLINELSELEEAQQLSRDKLRVVGLLLLLVLSSNLILHIFDQLDFHLQGLCGEDRVLGGCNLALGDDLCKAVEYYV